VRLLQVCNVGNILGGTAACAWTIARCFPDLSHTVAFLSPPTAETRSVFAEIAVEHWERVTPELVSRSGADLVILHNTSAARISGRWKTPTVCYVHSRITPPESDLTLYCSRWLAENCDADERRVLLQPVPVPPRDDDSSDTRALRERPVIGRICTPTSRKWPRELAAFYRFLAAEHPEVDWEFVGCPASLQSELREACGGRALFLPASWPARGRLWHWDAMLYHHPTLTESFGRTVAEALRAGCVPIVDRRGGFVEQLVEECGYLCDSQEEFSAAVGSLQNRARRWRLSRGCRAEGDWRFSLQRFRAEFLERLRNIDAPAVIN